MTWAAMAAGAAALSLGAHALSCGLALRRCAARSGEAAPAPYPPVSIVQPHRGLEPFSEATVASLFALDYPDYEILFCLASEADPVAPLLRRFIAAHPARRARVLFGEAPLGANPKLNNLVKGWKAAAHEWIVLADSNVLAPRDYLTRLMGRWRANTGLVCSPPVGAAPEGFAAHWECAFLNTYQARWQYAAEACGLGFAQGKTMLWRRRLLEEAGGVEVLASEIAEDAAATKLVRAAGLSAHLVDGPFPQPLGRRRLRDVWKRQVRWARMRRATFVWYFLPELLTTAWLPVGAAALAAPEFDLSAPGAAGVAALVWYACEALLAWAARWPLSWRSLPAWLLRDAALPILWAQALAGDSYEWRGATLSVAGAE